MDADQPPVRDKLNFITIDERISEESEYDKNKKLSSISVTQSLLSHHSSLEYSLFQRVIT